MKKKLLALLLCTALALCLLPAGCQQGGGAADGDGSAAADKPDSEKTADELTTIRVSATPFSGQILHAIAEGRGFYEEEGVNVEIQFTHNSSDALPAMLAGHVDVLSTYGTTSALQSISAGDDVTIFAGYMLQGCMPILAREGTEWHGVEDMVGKKVIGNVSTFYISGPLLDLGYDPATDVEWVQSVDPVTNMELVRKGEADYAPSTTGLQTQAKELGLEAVAFCSDVLPEYSCCRVWAETDWLEENQEAVKRLLKAWLRAQEVLETEPEYAVEVAVEQTELTQEYVEGFIYDDHFMIRLDPHWKAVSRAWDYLYRLDALPDADSVDVLKAHFNSELYKQALDECSEQYYDDNPEFYDYYQQYYEEVDNIE